MGKPKQFIAYLSDPGKARGFSTNSLVIKSVSLFLPQLYGAATPKLFEIALSVIKETKWCSTPALPLNRLLQPSLKCRAQSCTATKCTTLHCTSLHFTVLPSTAVYCTPLHYTARHCTTLRCTALHCTAHHCTLLH